MKKKEIIPEEKTHTEAEPNFPDIPEEIVVDIRSRLPLKSLARFTCVSKQWHSAISDIFAERVGGKMALVESIFSSGTFRTFRSIDEKCHMNGVSIPWNKKVVPWYHRKLEPLCYTKDGEALMFMSRSGESVRAYNPIDSSYKEILVQPNCDRKVWLHLLLATIGKRKPTYPAYSGNEQPNTQRMINNTQCVGIEPEEQLQLI
ncbi:hypothetical protein C3L33_14954, partial [Rhododendron williamsianum]